MVLDDNNIANVREKIEEVYESIKFTLFMNQNQALETLKYI